MTENWNSNPAHLTFQQVNDFLKYPNFQDIFAHSRLKKNLVNNLLERREELIASMDRIIREQSLFSIMSKSCIAGAVVDLGALADKLNPVIKPLMEAIKKEKNQMLQAFAARKLARVLEICVEKQNLAPADKVVKNLVTFVCADPLVTPKLVTLSLIHI